MIIFVVVEDKKNLQKMCKVSKFPLQNSFIQHVFLATVVYALQRNKHILYSSGWTLSACRLCLQCKQKL